MLTELKSSEQNLAVYVHIINNTNALNLFCNWQFQLAKMPLFTANHTQTYPKGAKILNMAILIDACCNINTIESLLLNNTVNQQCLTVVLSEDTPEHMTKRLNTLHWEDFLNNTQDPADSKPECSVYKITRKTFVKICLLAEQTTSW